MEDLAVYQRLAQLNRQKAALGLGFGGCNSYLRPDMNLGMGHGGVLMGGIGKSRRSKAAARKNPWLIHLAAVRRKHKGYSVAEISKIAKKSYKKGRKAPVRRRR